MRKMEKLEGKGKRWKVIIGLIILIIVLTTTEAILYQLRAQVNTANNVLVLVALNLNIILLVVLVLLVLRNLVKLYFERKRNVLGSKFRTRLVASFVGLSLIPCVLLFLVASNLINTSIDSWFNAQNEESLRKAMKVAQIYYDAELGKAFGKSRELSGTITKKGLLGGGKQSELLAAIRKMQQDFGLGTVKVLGARGEEIACLDNPVIPRSDFINSLPALKARALAGQEFSLIRKTNRGDLIEGVVPIVSGSGGQNIAGALAFSVFDPYSLMEEINGIKSAYDEYKQRKVFETPIKSSYIITFLLITLLIIFSATWFGFYLAKGITIPIQKLAEGTRKVASGNWDYKVTVQADDEIGMLVTSFNKMTDDLHKMTDDLHSAHRRLQTTNLELDRRRDYIETVLENIASGVVTIMHDGRIITINKAAIKMLRISKKEAIGAPYQTVFGCPSLSGLCALLSSVEERKKAIYEKEARLQAGGAWVHLLVSISVLSDKANQYIGMVCAFDDLTQLIKAQKVAAWQEVARRLAHEIKNPLTPIQLCTERLRKNFYENASRYEAVFEECTETIIQEVNDLKTMIDEFSQFARLPLPNLKPEDINHLITTMITRYRQMYPDILFEQHLAADLPLISLDREQIKRVFINLFDNAIDAMTGDARINDVMTGEVKTSDDMASDDMASDAKSVDIRAGDAMIVDDRTVGDMTGVNRTEKKLSVVSIYDRVSSKIRIDVSDNGKGISPEDKEKLFMPYFSTKKEGRGLGLAIVHRIMDDHSGSITGEDNHPEGTKFILLFPV
jgi:two-component system nitrogen regulation sensor histidine kinase NtrY